MNVLVIDGQGGGLGKQLVAALSTQCPEIRLTAVGTNSLAANAMRKAGALRAATGENAVAVNCRSADIIVGPIGIVIADALLGEITPAMATAVCQSHATRVLIPVNHCENLICLCLFPAETAAQPGNRPLLHCARSGEKASRKIPQDFPTCN